MVDTTGSEMKPRQREAEDGVTPKVGVEMEGQEKNTPRIEAMETEFGCGRQPGGSAGRRVGLREELKTQIGPQDLAETSRAGRGRLVAGGELRRDNRKMRTRGGRAGRRREPAAAARGSARTGTRASRFCTARQACAPSRASSARWLFRHPPCGGRAEPGPPGVLLWERAHSRCGGRGWRRHISCWEGGGHAVTAR